MNETLKNKPIVVGIDETGRAREAVRAAMDLATRLRTSLYVVHALPDHADDAMVESMARTSTFAERASAVREHLLQQLRTLAIDLGPTANLVLERLRVMPGPPAKALLETAREHQAGIIVLGPHQKRGFFDFGSTARAVLAHAPSSIWMQPARYEKIRSVLVPIDLSKDSLHALRAATQLAADFGAKVTVLHCFVSPEIGYCPDSLAPAVGPTYVLDELRAQAREEFAKLMSAESWHGVAPQQLFLEGQPIPLILELGAEHDLIVLGSHGRTGLSASLLGNVAYSILKTSSKPVWAIRHPDREFLI